MAKSKKKSSRHTSAAQKKAQSNMKQAAKACAGQPGEEFRACVSEQLSGGGLGRPRKRRR